MEPIPEDLLTRLQEPDERALVFNPLGMGGRMPPEQAARFQAATIEPARLAEDVPEGIRDYWERVRLLHQHGVLEYEFFSAAADLALLALEGALRRRFVDFYEGRIPVVSRRRPGAPKRYCSHKGSNGFGKPRATGTSRYWANLSGRCRSASVRFSPGRDK
jgi:hypothetical protein